MSSTMFTTKSNANVISSRSFASKPKAIDAFCGAGGLTIGLQRAGFELVASFDLDPVSVATLSNNPDTISHNAFVADVRNMLNGKLLAIAGIKQGELDLLAGGPPCQGFSVQRTIGGDNDSRNLLVDDYGDLILEVLPKYFLIENVPGIGGPRGREVLARFADRMRLAKYDLTEKVIDAQHYGVPQRRRRYIMIGKSTLSGAAGDFNWPQPIKGAPPTVRSAIGDLPSLGSEGIEHPSIPNHRADRLSELNRRRIQSISEGQGRTSLPDELLADCHKVSAEIVGHRGVYGRMAWDQVAPTITARFDSFTRGKFGHPSELRSISLREGARLQTFPDNYVFFGSKVEVARQIGNAVPPILAEALGKSIVAALTKRTVKND